MPNAIALFEKAGTNDFETVIRDLTRAARYVGIYVKDAADIAEHMLQDARELKNILVSAIANNHPDLPSAITADAYRACRTFLSNFDRYYTLNYDILLYWALMHDDLDELELSCDDGFRESELDPGADYVAWEDHQSATLNYLHGALHLFDSGAELQKYTWSRTNVPLINQIREGAREGCISAVRSGGYLAS